MTSHGVEHEELQAYLDRELQPGRREEIRRHLSACAECSAVLRDLQQVSAHLQAWQVEPAPATLRPPALESSTAPAAVTLPLIPRWRWRPMIMALSGTAVVALLILAVVIPGLMQSRLSVPPPPEEADKPVATFSAPPPPPSAAPPAVAGQLAKPSSREKERKHAADQAAPSGAPSGVVGALSSPLAGQRAREDFRKSEPAEGRQEGDYKDEVAAKSAPEAPTAAAPEPAAPAVGAERGVAGGFGAMAAQKRANAEAEEARRLIAYYVTLTVEVKEFTPAREKLDKVVDSAGGYVSEAASAETPGQPRQASLTLRVPADKLPGVLAELRALGRVVNEQLSTDEVTEQVVDLEARLRNSRATEQRLIAVLNERTGKVRDILEVEREIARTRQEIERMEAQRQNLMRRVELATVQVSLIEEYKAPLAPAPVGTVVKLRNAFVAGWDDFVGFFIGLALFFARNGLTLLFWFGVLYALWRRLKPRLLRLVSATQ